MTEPTSTRISGPSTSPRLTEVVTGRVTLREPEDLRVVSIRDWARLRRSIETLRNPIPWMEAAGWAAIGIGASAALSFVVWLAGYVVLTPQIQAATFYVGVIHVVVLIGAFAWGALALQSNRQLGSKMRADATSILTDMDEILATGPSAFESRDEEAEPSSTVTTSE